MAHEDVHVVVHNDIPAPIDLTLTEDPDVVINQTVTNTSAANITLNVLEDSPINIGVSISSTNEIPVDVTIFDPLFSASPYFTINGDLNVTGNITGNFTGNAATATKLQTARTINGVSFDGSANITVAAAAGTLTGGTLASGITASSLTSVGTLGSLSVTGVITATGGVSGNASTATKLQTARTINGVSFDGTANITVTSAAGTLTGTALASNVVSSSLTSIGTISNNPTFMCSGTIQSGSTGIQFLNGTAGGDAHVLFHVSGSVAGYFGLGAPEADLIFGGYSFGASRHRIYHSGNTSLFSATWANGARIGSWTQNGAYTSVQGPYGYLLFGTAGDQQTYLRTTAGRLNLGFDGAADRLYITSGAIGLPSLPGITTTSGYQQVYWDTTYASLARFTSTRKLKENIATLEDSGAIIDALNPVTFVAKANGKETLEQKNWRLADIQHGFIAEEVAEIDSGRWAVWEPDGDTLRPVMWRIHDLVALLVAETKSLRQRLNDLESLL